MRSFINRIKFALSLWRKDKIRFNVGFGGINHDEAWYATDINVLNLTKAEDWKKILFFLKVDNIMAEHVWEHLTAEDTRLANDNCFKFLKKNGRLRLAVPDGYHPDPEYIEYVRPGGHGAGADDHKILYNYHTMKERLELAGFKVEFLEYWDEHGAFHFKEWSDEAGHIMRSKRYDKRNQSGEIKYSSLIVDAIKP